MTLNIFDGSFAFQRTIVDTDSSKSSQKNYAPANDRDAFKVSGRSDTNAAARSKKSDEDFSAFLKSSQDDKETQENNARKAQNNDAASETRRSAEQTDDQKYAFVTQESTAVQIIAPSTIEDGHEIDPAVLLANLSEDIRDFIEELIAHNESEGQKIVTEVIVNANEPAPNVNSLLGMLVALAGKNDEQPFSPDDKITLADLVQAVQDLTQDDGVKVLTSNLTPKEMTDLQEYVQTLTTQKIDAREQDEIEAFVAQIIALVEPGTTRQKQIQEKNIHVQQANMSAAQKNGALPLSQKQSSDHGVQQAPAPMTSRFDGRYDVATQPAPDTLRDGGQDVKTLQPPAPNAHNHQAPAQQGSGERFLQLLQTSQGIVPLPDGAITQSGGTALTNASSPLQESLTNVITQSPSATQAHPATQMVSATIQKAVRAGDDTNIKLRLDPPELGRVEVKMSIDKDNITRIVLTAEKPETFLMLQRDADALHRAMADAGLDTQGDLSFELASEDHNFDDQHQQQDKASAGEEAELIEETTLDVQIDPVTGTVRYNILV